MARPLRIEFPGAIYHITSRGNEKKQIFFDDGDRKIFLEILADVNDKYNWICHAYCIMNNHYHLVIETVDGNLSRGMRQLNGVFTQSINKKYNKTGHVFQGRYKAILVQKESYLLELARYVVLNPVRAKIADNPKEWKWSSFRSTAGFEKPHQCLTIDWILGQFGSTNRLAMEKYVAFVKDGIKSKPILKEVRNQVLLGSDDFVNELIDQLNKNKDVKEIPRNQRHIGRPSLDNLFNEDMLKDKRNANIYEAFQKYAYSQKEIADHLGMHYSTVSRLIKDQKSKVNKRTK